MTFLYALDQLFAPCLNLLRNYATPKLCGLSNTLLVSDLQQDLQFCRLAGSLHDAAVASCFHGQAPASDGFNVINVDIDHSVRLTIQFQLYFFTASTGHSVAPAQYSLSLAESAGVSVAKYGCGLRDYDGQFWYPRTDKSSGQIDRCPDDESDWAIFATRQYGQTSLRSLIDKRKNRSKEDAS